MIGRGCSGNQRLLLLLEQIFRLRWHEFLILPWCIMSEKSCKINLSSFISIKFYDSQVVISF